ncbi:hypothetical protein B0H17DRAFT_397952 [Mycena rosella]|uniref:Uncharacterized protein n=1 Tax=Mycena rosella TaxID=1033263 RepID=A0AAD7CPN4_MYCRO|nr:hypothetical protein B0H17DRAFT_397952 [Mycena rosella]
MSNYDLQVLDTLETTDCLKGDLASDNLNIPAHMVSPDTDDSDTLPSQTHPPYPYGNPTNVKHPASRPRSSYDPSSRALFEDMGYDGGVNGALRWKDLAMEYLLPVDEEREEGKCAIETRKMASGASNAAAPQAGMGQDQTAEEDEEDENDENENDKDDKESEGTEGKDEDEEEEDLP